MWLFYEKAEFVRKSSYRPIGVELELKPTSTAAAESQKDNRVTLKLDKYVN